MTTQAQIGARTVVAAAVLRDAVDLARPDPRGDRQLGRVAVLVLTQLVIRRELKDDAAASEHGQGARIDSAGGAAGGGRDRGGGGPRLAAVLAAANLEHLRPAALLRPEHGGSPAMRTAGVGWGEWGGSEMRGARRTSL